MTEKQKYLRWLDDQKTKGLTGFSFSFDYEAIKQNKPTEEEIYGEINRMIQAPDEQDTELLGKYSPSGTTNA